MNAVITGASRGLGEATARIFALHGYDLFLTSKNEEKLLQTIDELKKDFLSKFVYKQLSEIETIIMEYDNYYPNKRRLEIDSENLIKEIIKDCLKFHKIKCENVVLEVNIWTDHESHVYRYKMCLKVDKIIKRYCLDIDYLTELVTVLIINQWKNVK